MSGGYLATASAMVITYLSGWLFAASDVASKVWERITPGQAALLIGLLTYATHNAPRFARGAAWLWRRLARGGAPWRVINSTWRSTSRSRSPRR